MQTEYIEVTAECDDYDTGFGSRIYTAAAFEAFLADLKKQIAAGAAERGTDSRGAPTVRVDEARRRIEFDDGGEVIALTWAPLEVIDKHEPVTKISYSARGFDSTWLHIE
jgi:hypothetical protein